MLNSQCKIARAKQIDKK